MRTLYIVPRQHHELYLYLRERFANDSAVEVILDRRVAKRSSVLDDSLPNRRHHPEVEAELQTRSHAILTLPAEPMP
jgi:hypothetical protein